MLPFINIMIVVDVAVMATHGVLTKRRQTVFQALDVLTHTSGSLCEDSVFPMLLEGHQSARGFSKVP